MSVEVLDGHDGIVVSLLGTSDDEQFALTVDVDGTVSATLLRQLGSTDRSGVTDYVSEECALSNFTRSTQPPS